MKTNISKISKFYLLLLILFSTFVYADNDIKPQDCIFSSVLGTRKDGSKIKLSGTSYIDNTSSDAQCKLNTFQIDGDLRCGSGNASATGRYQDSLNIDYTYTIKSPNTNKKPGGGRSHIVKNPNKILKKNKYNNIEQDDNHYSFTWKPSGNNIGVNKFDSILNTVTIDNIENKNLKIGQFITKGDDSTTLHLTEIPKNIQIYKLQTSGSNNFTVKTGSNPGLEASERIDIDSLFLKSSHNTNLTLKAPTVVIRKMDLTNYKNHITIYADEVDIDEIDFGKQNTLTIHPYTAGKKVKFYSRQLNISSSTQMFWDSGDYYVADFNIAGSGENISFVNASGPDQIINLFVDPQGSNHEFEIGNNFGINSAGINGNYGDNPAQNFRIFVNGDVKTGGGGTTFNALIYAEGEANLGSSTYLKGALSSYKDITIGNGSHFEPADDNGGWGSCGVFYDNRYSCGLFPSVLTSYTHITSNGSNDQACYTANISYPEGELDGDIKCDPSGCGGTSSCQRIDPPLNKYRPSFPENSKAGSPNGSNPTELTDLKYGDLTYSNKTIHFNPSQTYNDNDTKVMLLGDVNASKSTLKFEPGDYYFDSLTIDKVNNSVELPNGGPVRIFIKNDFSVAMNNLDFNTNGNQNDLFVYVGGNFNSIGNGVGTTSWKAYMYVRGDTTLNNNSNNWKIYGGITTEGTITINGNNPDFIQQGDQGESFGLGQCEETTNPPITYITGPFDAWDQDKNISNRVITTKIVNQEFNLTIASINKDNNSTETKNNIDIKYALYNEENNNTITNWFDFNASNVATTNRQFNISKAYQNVKVVFELCIDKSNDNSYTLYPYDSCSKACATNEDSNHDGDNTNRCWKKIYSSDAFAIRPYAFRVFGENQYKRAGEEFNVTIKAVDENNNSINSGTVYSVTGVSGYDANLSNLNITSQFYQPSPADINKMQTDTGETNVTGCPNAGTFTINNSTTTFTDGETNASLKFSETGILVLNISEKPGQEWALVDADDTNDSDRYIQPAIVISDTSDISKHNLLLFVPYRFDTTAQYDATNAKNWLYMHDISGSNSSFITPKMAAFIKYTITAKNKDGAITQNYTKTCFPDTSETNCPRVNGLKLNTTFDLFLDADINSSADANISLYTEDNSSSAVWTLVKDETIVVGENKIREWIGPKNFENGVGIAKVYFNIDKNNSITKNPVKINVLDANTSTSWMSNPGSPKEFIGVNVNQEKTFYYGRVHAPDYETDENSVKTPIYVEVYCNNDEINCSDFGITNWKESKDDVYWWINQLHSSPIDGNIISLTAISNTDITLTPNSFPLLFTSGINSSVNITYEGKNYPHKIRVDVTPSSWLKYNKFNPDGNISYYVTFKGSGNWAGIGQAGKTVDMNISKKTSKRIEW